MNHPTINNARTLDVLAVAIRDEIKLAFDAGRPHWLAIGSMLAEARQHFPASGPNPSGLTFHRWTAEHLVHPLTRKPIGERSVRQWMQAAREVDSGNALPETSLRSVVVKQPKHVEQVEHDEPRPVPTDEELLAGWPCRPRPRRAINPDTGQGKIRLQALRVAAHKLEGLINGVALQCEAFNSEDLVQYLPDDAADLLARLEVMLAAGRRFAKKLQGGGA